MQLRNFRVILYVFLMVCLTGALPAWAQSTSTGTVAGSVTDPSGAVVTGATVTLTDTATNTPRTTTTNADGRYIFVDVNPGLYNMQVNKQGFATTKLTNQEVKVGASTTLNVSMQVGGTNVVVEVEATGTELQTMNATVGNTVTATAIDNLPSIGRDVNTFIELQPGVSTGGDVAGAVNDQSYFSLDGGNNTNDMDGSGGVYTNVQQGLVIGDPTGGVGTEMTYSAPSGVVPTPADSVEEFKVNTAGQTADFNSSAGAEIKIVTKRGTNAFHGTAYDYYRDNNWSSNSWQNNWLNYLPGFHVDLPSYHYSRFGGALGGPLGPKEFLGGRTFFFGNYEGFRYPNSETITRNVPSPALQLGLLTDSKTGAVDYNLNNAPVTYNGVPYAANYGCAPATGNPLGLCDPLGIGLNQAVSQIWSKYEPASNAGCSQSLCDGANILGFSSNLSLPIKSNFGVFRLDHDFSAKHHLMGSYRYYNIQLASDSEVDIGGFFPGDTKGTPASAASDPVQDWFLVLGLTSNFTSTLTNDIHYSFLRNWWAWNRNGAPPQVSGLGGALEIMGGQTQTQDLAPFNSNNQQIRRRFWDGHDQMVRDDLSQLHGNHLFQFGGTYQHNFDYHQRNDSGGTINAFPVYSLGYGSSGAQFDTTGFQPCSGTAIIGGAPVSTSISNCGSLAAGVLGAVSVASQLFTRSGSDLALDPPLSNAFDKSTIPYYNVYFSDTWHMKPTFTFTYGLGWTLEMPPVEENGKQAMVVDQAGNPITVQGFISARRVAALQGNVYNPEVGFALVGNTAGGRKYPYNPYYGEFSPRVAVAWNPKFDTDSFASKLFGTNETVIRGGYGRSYGRQNGVTQVLLPLLGLGLEQPVGCSANVSTGGGGWGCNPGAATVSNAFRVSTAATAAGGPTVPLINIANQNPTLPQPAFPGYNAAFSASDSALDPNFRPSSIDSFDLTIQRQLNRRLTMEVGYIGRLIHNEYEPVDLNSVPYMTTLGGQTFASAYSTLVTQLCGGLTGLAGGGCGGSALPTPGLGPNLGAVTAQPFFETAMAGSSYCTTPVQVSKTSTITPANCTQAVALNEGIAPFPFGNLTNAQVFGLWSDLDNGPFTKIPRSMMGTPIAANCTATNTFGCSGAYSSIFMDSSVGHSNYNAGFVSLKMADWRGLTSQSNFTWSKALGIGAQAQSSSELTALDPFNIDEMYGRQAFNRKFIFNTFVVYQPPFYKGENGLMGRVLGGWTFATVFTAGSGVPDQAVSTFANYQSFGACDGVYCADYDSENQVPISPQSMHTSAHYCVSQADVSNGFAACPGQAPGSGYPVNAFAAGANNFTNWRNPILGIDNRDGGYGILTGLSYWNMDFSIKKHIRVAENVGLEFQGVFANVLNHDQWFDGFPYAGPNGISSYAWGALGGQASPREIELGARVRF